MAQDRVFVSFSVTKLKNLGLTVHLPPEEYLEIDDTHAAEHVHVSIHMSITEPQKD